MAENCLGGKRKIHLYVYIEVSPNNFSCYSFVLYFQVKVELLSQTAEYNNNL